MGARGRAEFGRPHRHCQRDRVGVVVGQLVTTGNSRAVELLIAAGQVWLTNVIVYGLAFWELDRGGPVARTHLPRHELAQADFRFPQDEDHDTVDEVRVGSSKVSDWVPAIVDYMYVSLRILGVQPHRHHAAVDTRKDPHGNRVHVRPGDLSGGDRERRRQPRPVNSAHARRLMRLMTAVSYDSQMDAFAIEPGVRLGEAYRRLFLGWGVTIPAGCSPNVGMGGHVLGGGFGYLCRQHGLAADHLYGVEVVVVDETGTARSVTATREPSDPNRDLWWAHTGGGGGNFGIVTRYWFRSPDAVGDDPAQLLPQAPTSVLTFQAEWNWRDIDRARFGRLVGNFGDWTERNSDASSRFAQLYGTLTLNRRQQGTLELTGLTTAGPDADHLVREHLGAVNERRRRTRAPGRRNGKRGWSSRSTRRPAWPELIWRTRSSNSRTLCYARASPISRSRSPTTISRARITTST